MYEQMDIEMEDQMSFVLKSSLQHMAMAKIAIEMWIQDDVVSLMPETDEFYPKLKDEMEIIIKMREKLHHLRLPKVLKDEFSAFIKPIGTQLLLWKTYLRGKFHLEGINLRKNIRWTSYGTIDQKKSALAIIRDQRLDLVKRFRLGCTYCLMDEIHQLMDELPAGQVLDFDHVVGDRKQGLVLFWTCYLTDELDELNATMNTSPNRHLTHAAYAFKSAVFDFNATATKFLFENILNSEEKNRVLVAYTLEALLKFLIPNDFDHEFTMYDFFPDLLRFLLSQMEPEQQVVIFKKYPIKVLHCFLIWPYHSLCAETAKRVWTFITIDFFQLLFVYVFDVIFGKINYGSRVCVYRDIFCQLWRLSSGEYRKYVFRSFDFFRNLYGMLEKGEEDICKMILADAAAEVEKLLLVREVVFFCENLIRDEKWDMLDFFLRKCESSAEFIKSVIVEQCLELKENRIRKCFQFCG